jgi:hypothetical protein
MKFTYTFILIAFAIVLTTPSCKKEQHGSKYVALDVNLVRGTEYQLNLSQYGDEDDIASIETQATDYTISEISTDASTAKYIYKYATAAMPKVSSTGQDNVVLKLSEPQRGCRGRHDETFISIKFRFQ